MKNFVYVLVFLALTAEIKGEIYDGKWETFLTPIGTALFTPSPLKLTIFDILLFVALFVGMGQPGAAKQRVQPVVKMMKVSLLSILGVWIWGVVRGGDVRQTTWQLHHFVLTFVAAFAFTSILRTPRALIGLGKTIFYAALYRATVLILFYVLVVRATMREPPPVMTTHSDTVLFVTGIVLVISYAMERRTAKTTMIALLVTAWIAVAIQLNNRRLAWVSLIGSLVVLYAMLPKARARKINRVGFVLAPILAMYIAVGWGRTEGIFKPVGSLSTMFGKHEDASSETRNIENYNLIITLKGNPLLGTGWGHEYNEVSRAYSIAEVFPQYRFIPHNSVLGLLAFSGFAGFVGTWLIFPVSAFFNARAYRYARAPAERTAAMVGVAEVVIYTNQLYGDMGMGGLTGSILMASAIAVSARLPVMVRAWPGAGGRAAVPRNAPANANASGAVPAQRRG